MGSYLSRSRSKRAAEELADLMDLKIRLESSLAATAATKSSLLSTTNLFFLFASTAGQAWVFFNVYGGRNVQIAYAAVILIVGIFLCIVLRRTVSAFYDYRIRRNRRLLVDAIEKKQMILENVMETETFKVAKQLLDQYGEPGQLNRLLGSPVAAENDNETQNRRRSVAPTQPKTERPNRESAKSREPTVQLDAAVPQQQQQQQKQQPQQRPQNVAPPPDPVVDTSRSPVRRRDDHSPLPNHPTTSVAPETPAGNPPVRRELFASPQAVPPPQYQNFGRVPIDRTPMTYVRQGRRPPPPEPRTFLDRAMDALLGEGPNSRFALICQHCSHHNGMVSHEEYESCAFYCYVCQQFNGPARHATQRKTSPRPAETNQPKKTETTQKQETDGNKSSGRNSTGDVVEETEHPDDGKEKAGQQSTANESTSSE